MTLAATGVSCHDLLAACVNPTPPRDYSKACADCPCAAASDSDSSRKPAGAQAGLSKDEARSGLRRLQALMGLFLFLSAGVGLYLLATDRSLWLLAVSHAVGLIMIVAIDVALGSLCIFSSRSAYVPSISAALLGFVLQLGDVLTAPQYNMTITYFAGYLFGLWAFDLLLILQLAVVVLGVLGRPYAISLSRRKTRKGRELNYTRRGFVTSVAGLAAALGLGILVSSIKLPAPTSTRQSTTTSQSAGGGKPVANVNDLKVGEPVYFDYPSGYPNMLLKNSDGSIVALSLLCTHVCCECVYDPGSDSIYCPCHGSVFDATGQVLQGPANAPLPRVNYDLDGAGNLTPKGVSDPGPCHV